MLEIIIPRGSRWEANSLMGVPRSPAIARCKCGREIELADSLDNSCRCGRCFNMSGREVVSSSRCDSQGEPYGDEEYYRNEN